ncbi:MAG: GyrI-like domain-containing protein [Candidatus Thiodiazotropha sp. (ex Epidulcina cf. delphinae)]|nr:GyrI-like domain-containing protein [Candidatus Thiodiazotropha sp. (ex Epidulcina cf. delphinae)]
MKIAIAIIAAVIIIVSGLMFFLSRGPDASQFDHIREPRISQMSHQKMVAVRAEGDPNVVGKKAFNLLFSIYFKIEGTLKGLERPAPRARWPNPLGRPKEEWVGIYALPVPQETTELPEYQAEPGLDISLSTWEYGNIAEILHIGPYDAEKSTVNKLVEFIAKQGYEIIGDHEEEYVKGPGLFGIGNPDKYLTIIRYQVKRVNESTQSRLVEPVTAG